MNWDHFVIFEITSKYCISDSFVDSERYFISSKRFLPTVVDIMVIWIKFTHSHPIYFTDSYDVNVQSCHLLLDHIQFTLIHRPKVPMQHCSLQYRTLLSPPDTSTTEHCFCFGSATSFFLELLVIAPSSSLVAYWTPSDPGRGGELIFWCCVFLLFHTVHSRGVLAARILQWFAIPSSSRPHFVRTLLYGVSVLGGPA